MSVCEVVNNGLLDANGIPKVGGLLDLRLGTNDRQMKCQTCGGDSEHCVGHFGHISLARPVYHIGFIPFVLKVLRCVCHHCSRLMLEPVRESTMRVIWSSCAGSWGCAEGS